MGEPPTAKGAAFQYRKAPSTAINQILSETSSHSYGKGAQDSETMQGAF